MKFTLSYTVDRMTITGPLARVVLEADRRQSWAPAVLLAALEGITREGGHVVNTQGIVIAGTLEQLTE